MGKKISLMFSAFLLIVIHCKSIESEHKIDANQRKQATIDLDYTFKDNKILFSIKNNLQCPIRINLKTNDEVLAKHFDTLTLQKLSDTLYVVENTDVTQKNLLFNIEMGDLERKINQQNLVLPFPRHKSYKIVQAHNGSFSHDEINSKFAVDFDLKEGDTVTSADDGFVVGVVDWNDKYGADKKFQPYANFVTTYNEKTGIYSQYVHLQKDKVFVKVGDKVVRNQPIGLVGLSGFISGVHLHFNTRVPAKSGMKSIASDFENYKGEELYKGQIVSH